MDEIQFTCDHSCKNTCATLHEALTHENAILQIYKNVVDECNMLDIKNYINERIAGKRKVIFSLLQMLDEMKVKSQVIDEIAGSYEKISG
ncbi:hypothetical protein BMS3Abin03_00281 [bacterium BMS3Abin03]|nr:hypothetical protein BMS3Abin03_00281 [bacterium BMS3Abin03]